MGPGFSTNRRPGSGAVLTVHQMYYLSKLLIFVKLFGKIIGKEIKLFNLFSGPDAEVLWFSRLKHMLVAARCFCPVISQHGPQL